MNEPIEQKKVGDYSPSAQATVNDRTGLFIALVGMGAGLLAVGMSIGAILIAELEISHAQAKLEETTKQYRLLDNDWQITNAWLAAHHVVKDVHGNYYFEGEKHGQ